MKFLSYTYPWLESILKKEIESRKIKIEKIEDGQVIFSGNETTIVKSNLWLRTANKVYILLKEEKVEDFDKLFELVYDIDWKKYIWNKFNIHIKANSHKSILKSEKTIQSISQKAIYEKLSKWSFYQAQTNLNIEIRIDIYKNNVKILLDTSWEPLYKRWYRKDISYANLKETLAAWIILLSNCKSTTCYDPFCGSGTLLIEKALIDLNIAPWMYRNFIFENFDWIDKNKIEKEKWRAWTRKKEKELKFFWYDIDKNILEIAKDNVKNAWLDKYIKIEKKNFWDIKKISECIITNPPYGKRIKVDNIEKMYEKLLQDFKNIHCGWIITGYEWNLKEFYDNFKVRVLSNGWEKVKFFWKN